MKNKKLKVIFIITICLILFVLKDQLVLSSKKNFKKKSTTQRQNIKNTQNNSLDETKHYGIS